MSAHPVDVLLDLVKRFKLEPIPEGEISRMRAECDGETECTGVAAMWCPIHGDCECSEEEQFNDFACPLHSPNSVHAER